VARSPLSVIPTSWPSLPSRSQTGHDERRSGRVSAYRHAGDPRHLVIRQFVPACPRFFSGTVSCQLLSHPISCLRSGWKLTRWTVYNSRNLVFNLWSLLDRFSRFGAFFSVPPVCWAHLKLCAASKLSQQCFVEKVRLDILHTFL
jgi:hypothetical protein